MGIQFESRDELLGVLKSPLLSVYKGLIGYARSSGSLDVGKGDIQFNRILSTGNVSTVAETVDSHDPRLLLGRRPRGYGNVTCLVDLVSGNYRANKATELTFAPMLKSLDRGFGQFDSNCYQRQAYLSVMESLRHYAFRVTGFSDIYSVGSPMYGDTRAQPVRKALYDEFNNNYPTFQEGFAKVRKGHVVSVAVSRSVLIRSHNVYVLQFDEAKKDFVLGEADTIHVEYRGAKLLKFTYKGNDVAMDVAPGKEGLLKALRNEKIVSF